MVICIHKSVNFIIWTHSVLRETQGRDGCFNHYVNTKLFYFPYVVLHLICLIFATVRCTAWCHGDITQKIMTCAVLFQLFSHRLPNFLAQFSSVKNRCRLMRQWVHLGYILLNQMSDFHEFLYYWFAIEVHLCLTHTYFIHSLKTIWQLFKLVTLER
jgi:hypothetical protein